MPLPLFVRSEIDDMTDLTPNAMRVYMHLARRADASGVAWPSYQAIGDHCFKSVSENPVTRKSFARRAVDELIAAGLVSKEAREREDGGQTSNGYKLSPVDSKVDPMPIDTGMLIDTPMLTAHPPMPIDTPHAYKAPNNTPIEDTPNSKPDGDSARARMGDVYGVWSRNIPGMMSEILGEKLADLVQECGEPSVIYGIEASIEANARNFKYVAACARNHAAGKSAPAKQQARAPGGGDYRPATNAANNRQAVANVINRLKAQVNGHG